MQTPPSVYSRPARITRRPSKFDVFDVKYGSLSSVEAFFATLPDLLRDPAAQREFELDTLENLIQQLSADNETLTYNAFIASKSDLETLMYHEAMMAMYKQEFRNAMEAEINRLEQQKTWNIVPQTKATDQNKKILPRTWTFKRKQYPNGCIRKYKAHFCLRGDKQVDGIDVFKKYSPVLR